MTTTTQTPYEFGQWIAPIPQFKHIDTPLWALDVSVALTGFNVALCNAATTLEKVMDKWV